MQQQQQLQQEKHRHEATKHKPGRQTGKPWNTLVMRVMKNPELHQKRGTMQTKDNVPDEVGGASRELNVSMLAELVGA